MTFPLSAYLPYTNKEGKTTAGCIPYDSTLEAEIEAIRTGKHREVVERLRMLTDKHEKHTYKATYLPCFTASSITKQWRNTQNIVQHTGLICIDIDGQDNEHVADWGKLRDDLFLSTEVAACFVSASGKGVAVIVHIVPGHHIASFKTIAKALKEKGITVDEKCVDLVRLRFSSYDPEAKYREEPDLMLPDPSALEYRGYDGDRYKVTGPVNGRANYRHAIKSAEVKHPFAIGSRHWHLLHVGAYCNHIGMSLEDCESHTLHFYQKDPISPAQIADLSNDALLEPIRSAYKSYKTQHGTYKPTKPKYNYAVLKKLLNLISKELLRNHIDRYGEHSYIGDSGRTFTVDNSAAAFFMYMLETSITWTTQHGYDYFSREDIRTLIPENAYLDSCNGSRVWCCKTNKIPLSWL